MSPKENKISNFGENKTWCLQLSYRRIVRIFNNPFLANDAILRPSKAPEKKRFSGIFRAYKMVTSVRNRSTLSL